MRQLSAFTIGRCANVIETRPLIGALVRGLRFCALMLARSQPRGLQVFDGDEPGDATLRDLGLEREECSFGLVDIHPGIESTRMRLFVLTGNFWRGT